MYVGYRYSISVSGSRWKAVHCTHCHTEWAYQVTRQATGAGRSPYFLDEDGAQERARASAAQKLERLLDAAVEEIACPKCGWYQAEMAQRLRARQYSGLAMLSAFGLAGAIGTLAIGGSEALLFSLAVAGLMVAAAVAGLVRRAALQAGYDPNADAHLRAHHGTSPESTLITRERYERLVATAAARGAADKLPFIEWARAEA